MFVEFANCSRDLPMFNNLLTQTNSLFSVAGVSYFLYVPLSNFSGFSILVDLSTRLDPHDTLFSSYYFWWTNLTYLPLFFFLLYLTWVKVIVWLPGNQPVISFLIFLLLYPFEVFDHITLNALDLVSSYSTSGLNVLLTNSLNRYHPLVFYLSAIPLLSLLMFIPFGNLQSYLFLTCTGINKIHNQFWWGVILNLIALWMGSWWALQEGTWGGWWNWDSSETFGLTISLLLLSVQHSTTSRRVESSVLSKLLVSNLIVLLSYFFIQLNFELVSHNFGSKFFFFFNNNLFFIEVVLTIVIYLYNRIIREKIQWLWILVYINPVTPPVRSELKDVIGKLVVPGLLALWVITSYTPLANYFSWNFFTINIFNNENSVQPANFMLWLLGTVWFIRPNSVVLVPLLAVSLSVSSGKNSLIFLYIFKSRIAFLHLLVLLLLTVNLHLFDLITYKWLALPEHLAYPFTNSVTWLNYSGFCLNSFSIDLIEVWGERGSHRSIVWSTTSITNTPLLNFFTLLASDTLMINLYNLCHSYTRVYLCVEIPQIHQISAFFSVCLISVSLEITRSSSKYFF